MQYISYEWFRKQPEKQNQIWDNAGFNDPKRQIYFLLGNLFRYRASFIIISTLSVPKGEINAPMFPMKKRTSRNT